MYILWLQPEENTLKTVEIMYQTQKMKLTMAAYSVCNRKQKKRLAQETAY